ncbi:MAG: hypothetical protein UY92_C0004G0061 [Candidatus Magasanikbacteria bacterium GW2011_GWA2_56_11]|uniref:Uncharacterized protein n=1 Tax=Candidatus Magasanikbacteria bacterium GW2011_GWA2_56_11 TaxID=1619044 RepID=A0A0G1YHQ5_9BACT|nr:MAG: hypothetical protein UY92_C0004G0061 [Candidatus Magasanikbacteria bacterium GW2011_GWA2_56_11]
MSIKPFTLSLLVLALTLAPAYTAQAKKTLGDTPTALNSAVAPTGIEKTDVLSISGKVVKGALGMVGLVFFVLMVYAGIRWMTARGDEDAASKSRDTMIAAVIGLIIIVASYAITSFVTDRIVLMQTAVDVDGSGLSGDMLGNEPLACCIVPATANPNSPYTASLRTEAECASLSEGGVQGADWEIYHIPNNNFTVCEAINNCWNNPNGSQSTFFAECLSKAGVKSEP